MRPQSQQTPEAGHERRDADTLGLTMIAAFLLLTVAICFLCVFGLLRVFHGPQNARNSTQTQTIDRSEVFPLPRLQANPESDLRTSRAAASAKLNSYGWIDRKAGVAHIPIERAIQITLQRGLPEVGGGQTRLQLMQSRPETNSQPNEPITAASPEATP